MKYILVMKDDRMKLVYDTLANENLDAMYDEWKKGDMYILPPALKKEDFLKLSESRLSWYS